MKLSDTSLIISTNVAKLFINEKNVNKKGVSKDFFQIHP